MSLIDQAAVVDRTVWPKRIYFVSRTMITRRYCVAFNWRWNAWGKTQVRLSGQKTKANLEVSSQTLKFP